jgi:hypothetical protein
MMLNLALFALATAASTGNPIPATSGLFVDRHRIEDGPAVEVWTNKDDDLLRRGDQVSVYFRASESGYVTVFRIDTDGRVRVIYPHDPWEDNYVRAGQRYEVRGYGDRQSFIVDDYPGEGYVFAVASRDPFDYGNLVRGDHWDYRVIADGGRVTGDPYVAVTDLVDRIVPPNYSEYTYDVFPYFVEERHQYPRFLCYECHSYASYTYWNPYSYSCFRFRIVIYDDFYYYPNRRYGGARVVYRNSPRIAPRYVFKDRGPSEAFVTTVRQRPVDQNGRGVADRGATARDLGGSGRLPTPINTGRQRPGLSSDGNGASAGSSTGQSTYGTGRRVEGQSQNAGGSATSNDRGRTTPYERPGRQVESGNQGSTTTSGSGRRGTEGIIPPAPGGDRQQPTLERRDPRDTPGRQGDTGAQTQGSDDGARAQPQSEPRREPRRTPERQVEPQPESRQPTPQPESRQPERRAEPRSEPRQSPQAAPSRSSGGSRESGRASNGGSSRSSGASSGTSQSSGGESSSSSGSGRRTN